MDVAPRKLQYYHTSDGQAPYRLWYYSLADHKTKAVIRQRLTRLERGLLGDTKSIGSGVYELRIDFGPGYRLYFGLEGKILVWLLCAGDKSTQDKDIKNARAYWAEYLRRK